jgi:hypothetical protein
VPLTAKERDAAERAAHLARVCAGLPTTISLEGAQRLARMFTASKDGEMGV